MLGLGGTGRRFSAENFFSPSPPNFTIWGGLIALGTEVSLVWTLCQYSVDNLAGTYFNSIKNCYSNHALTDSGGMWMNLSTVAAKNWLDAVVALRKIPWSPGIRIHHAKLHNNLHRPTYIIDYTY